MKAGKNLLKLCLIAVVIIVICLAVHFSMWDLQKTYYIADDGFKDMDLARISQEQFDSVFLSMHSPINFLEEDFLFFRGTNTLVGSHTVHNLNELGEYLDAVFATDNELSVIFLSLDPYRPWITCQYNFDDWASTFYRNLYFYLEEYPDIAFEILLAYPSLEYWMFKSEDETDVVLSTYRTFVNDVASYENTSIYFLGSEYWLIGNPTNYSDSFFDANADISLHILLSTYCDRKYQISPDDREAPLDALSELIAHEKAEPTRYPDLSEISLVFFGDSIIANTSGSYSIPGYINGLSGAAVYSCAHGGTRASTDSPGDTLNFPDVIDDFLDSYCTADDNGYKFQPTGSEISQDSLYFIIIFGLNDYFMGIALDNPDNPYDISTYAGGLRSSITALQEAFPEARFVILTPTYTGFFSNGTDINGENGGVLTDYVEKAIQVAQEFDIDFLDYYHDLGIDASNLLLYTDDLTHPNELGRLTIATHLMYDLENLMSK